jgi:uncharacterized membrane protein YfcA
MLIAGVMCALAIGVALGLFGGGGSILTVPVLSQAFGLSAHDAIATSLVVVGVTSASALVGHVRRGHVRWRLGLAFGAVSMTAAFGGGVLGAALPARALLPGFALVMIAAGIAMLRRARGSDAPLAGAAPRPRRVLAVAAGVGLLTGVFGAGGGFLIVPALTLFGGLTLPEAIGTSLLAIVMNTGAGFAGHAAHARIDVRLAAAVTLIAMAGSTLGTRIAQRLPGNGLARAFGWFVIAVGVVTMLHVALT